MATDRLGRKAYAADLRHWPAFLAGAGVHPLTEVRRLHTHAWLRAQEAVKAKPATQADIAQRLCGG